MGFYEEVRGDEQPGPPKPPSPEERKLHFNGKVDPQCPSCKQDQSVDIVKETLRKLDSTLMCEHCKAPLKWIRSHKGDLLLVEVTVQTRTGRYVAGQGNIQTIPKNLAGSYSIGTHPHMTAGGRSIREQFNQTSIEGLEKEGLM